MNVQGDSKLAVQTLRRDRAHHKDSELHRNICPQTSSQRFYEPCVLGYFLRNMSVAFEC